MMYALNDPRASLIFIDCFIVLKWMLKCVLLVQISDFRFKLESFFTGLFLH